MNEELNQMTHTMNAIECDGYDRQTDCRPMHSNDFSRTGLPLKVRASIDNHSMSSSKSSVKSNGSEERNSVTSHKIERNMDSRQRRLLPKKDHFCWDCHKEGVDYSCKTCLRSYHQKCPSLKRTSAEMQSCPECIGIMQAEEGTNPSGCMQWLNGNVDRLAELLEYTIVTVKTADRNQSFHKPVSIEDYPQYPEYIVNPMDLSLVEENVKNKTYASTNSFLADIKWIFHNCYVFNSGGNNRLIAEAKNIIRVAKQECEEIEICPDCYLNYYTLEEDNYFAAVCEKPHAIVWAKLKGYPFWPAKVVRYNQSKNEVDVRFFGTHDKCWLKPEKCYLMSQDYPYNRKPLKFDQSKFDQAIIDMNLHLDLLEKKFKNMFRFYEKMTPFTVDKLYLSGGQKSTPTKAQTKCFESTEIQIPTKKVLNSYNGIHYKTLKVKPSLFDPFPHISKQKSSPEMRSPATKRIKLSNGSPKSKKKCISNIALREELDSLESDQSFNDSRDDNKNDRSFTFNNSFDEKSNSKKHLNENRFNSSNSDANDCNRIPRVTPVLSHSQTVTVSGKSSEILNLNNFSPKLIHESSDNSNKLLIDLNEASSVETPDPSPKPRSSKSPQKLKISSNEENSKKIKSLEFKNRKLEEDLSEAKSRITALEEEIDELKKSNEELQNSIPDIKKKQWCTNCFKEAILPCCWNTCYCTVECQHQHWPIHSKICRRRQQQTRT